MAVITSQKTHLLLLIFFIIYTSAASVMAQEEREAISHPPLFSTSILESNSFLHGKIEKLNARIGEPKGKISLRSRLLAELQDQLEVYETAPPYGAVTIQPFPSQALSRSSKDQAQEEKDPWAQTRKNLERSTLVGLWLTGSLGTLLAFNRPTLFSDGRCNTGNPIFGDYGCGELSTVHGMSAVAAISLYTASEVFNLTTGPDQRPSTTHRIFSWIHRIGMVALPLVGIFSRFPEVIGVNEPDTQEDFSRTLRSIHLGAGYVTVLSYTVTFSTD